jgi:putative restriction endonuclease
VIVPITDLLDDAEWDRPFFKRLAHNDTGAAAGHQGGIVIPTDLRQYLPGLIGTPTSVTPTLDVGIVADLYLEGEHVCVVQTRYQMQTWGGTRSPETRITKNLGPIRNEARAGDILILQRLWDELIRYRLILVRHETEDYARSIQPLVGERRYGLLFLDRPPLSEPTLAQAREEERQREARPFELFDRHARVTESTITRIARSQSFREAVRSAYGDACCVCGSRLVTPAGMREVQAAHIVPRHLRGVDDARNGLCLCRRHRWAFENGLFGLDDELHILVPRTVATATANESLATLAGQEIRRPAGPFAPHPLALAWHRENRMNRWV